jgi:pimeloyl-ACP methyl ester carboxylesterase
MKEDLREFMDKMDIEKAVLIGHSMGGKSVMFFARDYPERVNSLIVVDIAPKSYNTPGEASLKTINHRQIIGAMKKVDFYNITSRQDVEEELSHSIANKRVRQFLMKNLHRNKDNTFNWSLNVDALEQNMPHILEGMCEKDFEKGNGIVGFPVLFVRGANSQYILDEDIDNIILTIFPFAEVVTIPKAGHWVHAEQPALLVKNILYFVLE